MANRTLVILVLNQFLCLTQNSSLLFPSKFSQFLPESNLDHLFHCYFLPTYLSHRFKSSYCRLCYTSCPCFYSFFITSLHSFVWRQWNVTISKLSYVSMLWLLLCFSLCPSLLSFSVYLKCNSNPMRNYF